MTTDHATNTEGYETAYAQMQAGLTDAERAAIVHGADQLDAQCATLLNMAGRGLYHVRHGEFAAADSAGRGLQDALEALAPDELVNVCGRHAALAAGYVFADQIEANR